MFCIIYLLTEDVCSDIWQGNPMSPERNVSKCYFPFRSSYMKCAGTETGLLLCETLTNLARYDTVLVGSLFSGLVGWLRFLGKVEVPLNIEP
jgi:hypothetical protein